MRSVTTTHTEIAMNHLIAIATKPLIASIVLPGIRYGEKLRLATGFAITLGGAGVFLSDLTSLVPLLG